MKKVLVDTSVWIENERKGVQALQELLREDRVLLHWAIVGELAVGHIKNRETFLSDLRLLEFCDESTPDEALKLIEKERLYGKGFSLVDCLLLTAARKSDALIFSFEKKLNTYPHK